MEGKPFPFDKIAMLSRSTIVESLAYDIIHGVHRIRIIVIDCGCQRDVVIILYLGRW